MMSKIDPDETTTTRIKNSTVTKIEKLIQNNPIFTSNAEVIDYAIDLLIRMEKKK